MAIYTTKNQIQNTIKVSEETKKKTPELKAKVMSLFYIITGLTLTFSCFLFN